MNIVEQLIGAVQAGGRVAGTICLASAAVLVCNYYDPQWFGGVPVWVLPAIRILAIFSLVVWLVPASLWLTQSFRRVSQAVMKWVWRRNLEQMLKEIDINELVVLSLSVARTKRELNLNADDPVVMTMVSKKLLEMVGFSYSDGTHVYRVPEDVWNTMHSMKEFVMEDGASFARYWDEAGRWGNGPNLSRIQPWLPQTHKAVLKRNGKSAEKP